MDNIELNSSEKRRLIIQINQVCVEYRTALEPNKGRFFKNINTTFSDHPLDEREAFDFKIDGIMRQYDIVYDNFFDVLDNVWGYCYPISLTGFSMKEIFGYEDYFDVVKEVINKSLYENISIEES